MTGTPFPGAAALWMGGFLLWACLIGNCSAQVPVLAGKSWSSLSGPQQQILAPLAAQWPQMDAASRDTWAALAVRYPQLGPTEQQRLKVRMSHWAALTPAERQRVHQGFMAAQRVASTERQHKWDQYQALPSEAKQALQERGAKRLIDTPSVPLKRVAATPVTPQTVAFADPHASRPLAGATRALDAQTLLPRKPSPP